MTPGRCVLALVASLAGTGLAVGHNVADGSIAGPVVWLGARIAPGATTKFEANFHESMHRVIASGLYQTYQVETGERAGEYVAVSCLGEWAALDVEREAPGIARRYSGEALESLASLDVLLTVPLAGPSQGAPSRCWEPLGVRESLVDVTSFRLRPGGEARFRALVEATLRGRPGRERPSFAWHRVVSGDHLPTYVLAVGYDTWAELGAHRGTLLTLLRLGRTEGEAGEARASLEREVWEARNEVWRLRYDLSQLGAQAAPPPPAAVVFPWPPPRWTSRLLLPDGLVTTGKEEPVGSLLDRLVACVRRAGITQWSTYPVPDGGLALVTQLEHIGDDGQPEAGTARWSVTAPKERPEAGVKEWLSWYVRELLRGQPGRYRFVVFVVTDQSFTASPRVPSFSELRDWSGLGPADLPASLKDRVAGTGFRCEALVYEFYKAAREDPAVQVETSSILAMDHLVAAGFWDRRELNP